MKEAARNHVLPIDDRTIERVNAATAGRPDLMAGRTSLTLAEGMTGMTENIFINIKNRSKTITAEVEVGKDGGNGAIIVQGGRFGGWALYVKDGVPAYDYNFLGLQRFTIAAKEKLKPGNSTVRFQFDYDGGGLAKGGLGTLYVNDKKVAEGRIPHTQPMIFSADETADVGIDLATPVVESIGSEAKSKFTGKIPKVTVEIEEMKQADKAEEYKARAVAAHKMAVSD
jgi:arylsulfatase